MLWKAAINVLAKLSISAASRESCGYSAGAQCFWNKTVATESEERRNWIKRIEGSIGKNVLLEERH
uniref:PH domain-containing protein n=1 Tax=Romanomermis culicivorax TaxID=13658 RepID=A0A915JQW7_ROMCU